MAYLNVGESFSSAGSITDPSKPSAKPLSPEDIKTKKVVSRCTFGDLVVGVARSKVFRALVFSGLAIGALFLTFHLLGLGTPTWWMITAAGTGGFVLAFLAQLPFCKGMQKLSFEVTAIGRLGKHDYHKIDKGFEAKGKLFLGALPNQLAKDGELLVNDKSVQAVISVNEQDWETKPLGLSVPYLKKDWEKLGVELLELDVKDHTLVEIPDLHRGADFLHQKLDVEGVNAFVHCRGGVGRSATVIAAYLIKYKGMSPDEARDSILAGRPKSTIAKKMMRLQEFYDDPLTKKVRSEQSEKR